MTRCDRCGEKIDGPSYVNPFEPSEILCGHCHKRVTTKRM